MATGNYRELKAIENIVNEALDDLDKVSLSGLLGFTHLYSEKAEYARKCIDSARNILMDIREDLNS